MPTKSLPELQDAPAWRERPLLPMRTAAELAGVSRCSLYKLSAQGRLKLKRLAGRVLVETESFARLVESAEEWVPARSRRSAR